MPRFFFILAATFLLCSPVLGQSSNRAKIMDVHAFTTAGTPLAVEAGGVPIAIDTSTHAFTIQVAIDDMAYSGEFGERRYARPADFIVGDTASVAIEGSRMYLYLPNGKKIRGRLVRRERLAPAPPSQVG